MEPAAEAPSVTTPGEEFGRAANAGRPADPPFHVLTITPFYPAYGNESRGCFIAEPLAELSRMELRNAVFAVEPVYRAAPRASSSAPGAIWFRYPSLPAGMGLASAGLGVYWRLRQPVARLHRRLGVDLIHAHGALPCGHAAYLLSRSLNIPYLVSVHGLDAFSSLQVEGLSGVWCKRVSRRVFRNAHTVIGVSRRVAEEVEKGIGGRLPHSPSVVYNGVDTALFAPGLEPSIPVLLTVGNLIPSKGHELIVRSLALLKPEFPELIWEVIGDGPELDRIGQLARGLGVLGSIRFLGRRSRQAVAEAFRRCTVFVLPSHSEGLGCAYLEAMACGKVALGCFEQGIEEVIRHGENGWLIPPNGLQELTEGLKVLLAGPGRRAHIGTAARQTILDGFTLQHQAQRLLAIYRECSG